MKHIGLRPTLTDLLFDFIATCEITASDKELKEAADRIIVNMEREPDNSTMHFLAAAAVFIYSLMNKEDLPLKSATNKDTNHEASTS